MTYTKATATDAESVLPDNVEGELWMMRDVLETESLGFSVLALEAGEETMRHAHGDDDLEEIYYVVEGGVDVDFGDRTVSLDTEEALRISPDEERLIRNRNSFSKLVLVSAPV